MLGTRVFLLRSFLPVGALHPGRWARGRGVIRLRRLLVLIARARARLDLVIGPPHAAAERIGLADQPRKLSQRVALLPCRCVRVTAAMIIVIGGKRSVLISISHCDDASPSGKLPIRPHDKIGRCQMPPQVPM